MKTNRWHFDCECLCSVMRVIWDEEDEELYISIFKSKNNKMSWLYRIQAIINILLTGDPYEDEIIVNKKDAKRLAENIEEVLKVKEKEVNYIE